MSYRDEVLLKSSYNDTKRLFAGTMALHGFDAFLTYSTVSLLRFWFTIVNRFEPRDH